MTFPAGGPASGQGVTGTGSGTFGSGTGAGANGGGTGGSGGAAGSGGGHGSGSAAARGTGVGRRRHYQLLLKRIIEAHKQYPLASRRHGEEGSCQRRFVLARDGSLKHVESVTSCDHTFLDEAATRAIVSVGKFPPFPAEMEEREASFTVTIIFSLSRK